MKLLAFCLVLLFSLSLSANNHYDFDLIKKGKDDYDAVSNSRGGAISANLYTKPEIKNSTFSNNTTDGLGGGIFCDVLSNAEITDCIFEKCNNSNGRM